MLFFWGIFFLRTECYFGLNTIPISAKHRAMKWNILMITLMMQSTGNGAISPKITKESVM